MAMTLQQKAIDIIGRLPEDKIIQVIQFAEFLSFDQKPQREEAYSKEISKDGYIRKPGILKKWKWRLILTKRQHAFRSICDVSNGQMRTALVS